MPGGDDRRENEVIVCRESLFRTWPRRLAPYSPRGRWSVSLLVGSLLLFVVFFALVASGQRGGDTFFSNVLLSGTILAAAALTVAAGVVGSVAIVKDRDRTPVVIVAVAAAVLVLGFVAAEVALPH